MSFNSPSSKTRKSRSAIGLVVLSAIAKAYSKKIINRKPWDNLSAGSKRLALSEEDISFDTKFRCPNCNRLLAKIRLGDVLNLMDNSNPPVIEIKCTKTECGKISRHSILKKGDNNMASDKDIRRMVDEYLVPFFEEGLPEIIRKLDTIESRLDIVDTNDAEGSFHED